MPNISMPNGDVVAFPDEMPADQIKGLIAKKFPDITTSSKPKVDTFDTVSDQGLQGATFGIGNRMQAGLAALALSGINGKPIGENYKAARQVGSERLQAEMQQNPGTAISANLSGALATGGLGAGTKAGTAIGNSLRTGNLATRVAKGAAAGAATGAAYGAGTSAYGKTSEGARSGAISGGLVGGVIPGIGAAASSVKNEISSLIKASPETSAALKNAAQPFYDKFTQSGAAYSPKLTNEIATLADSARATGIAGTTKKADESLNGVLDFYSSLRGKTLSPSDIQKLDQSFADDISRFNRGGEYNFGRILNNLKYEFRDRAYNPNNVTNYINTGGVDITKLHNSIDEWGKLKDLERHLQNTIEGTAQFAGKQSGFWRQKSITRAAEDARNLANVKKQISQQEGVIKQLESAAKLPTPDVASLLQGNRLWNQSYKAKDIEKILAKSQGTENPQTSIRTGLKNLLANDKKMAMYNDSEKAVLQDALKRGYTGGLIKLFGGRLTDSIAGGMAGLSAGGPIGGVAGAVAGKAVGGGMANLAGGIQANRLRGGLENIQSGTNNITNKAISPLLSAPGGGIAGEISGAKTRQPLRIGINPQDKLPMPQVNLPQSSPQSNAQPQLFERVIQQESRGNQAAISPKGAIGVAQIMPRTAIDAARAAGLPYDFKRLQTDREYNAALGKAYLDKMLDKYNGNETHALVAYNWGPGNTDKWLRNGANPVLLPKETRNYIQKILGT